MKFCQPHWVSLTEALLARGLAGLISESGEDAATKQRRQLEGEDSIDSYEPLLEAHAAIETGYDYMIDKAADDVLEHWEGLRL